jgi:VWFA-related protein
MMVSTAMRRMVRCAFRWTMVSVATASLIPGTSVAVAQGTPATSSVTVQSTWDASTPTLQVYSREIVVDVLVTDNDGKPVYGLKRSDFTLEEDARPQPIRGFYEVGKETSGAPATPLPPDTYSNAHTLPANGPVQIFYFELPPGASLPPGSDPGADFRQSAPWVITKPDIASYLRTMPAGTQVAIFAFRSDYGLHLLQGFTTDGQRAAAAVDNLVVLSPGKPPSFDRIAAANQIAAYVAGIHGRKNLIWIGSPMNIMRDGGLAWSKGGADMTYVHRLMDTYDRFTQEQIAIYPLDPHGVVGLGLGNLRVEEIAGGTGGAAFYNNNDLKIAAAKIVDDTSHYYTVSYVPPRAREDGRYHPIKITVDRPGLRLNYRGGYNSEQLPAPDSVLRVQMTQNTMGLGALPASQLLFDATVTPSQPKAADPASPQRTRIALAGKVPVSYDTVFALEPGQIAFADKRGDGGTYNGSVEFDLAAYDADGKAVGARSQTLNLTLTPDEYQEFEQTAFKFFLPIDLPPGEVTLRLGVFDGVSNKVGTLEVPLRVSKK